jgi:hypothetical protein
VELRHGLEVLWPSELADQFYCEYKVHLKHLHPEVVAQVPALEVGSAGHEALASVAQPISPAQIEEAIRTGKKLALCEWTLEGEVEGIRLRGRPDYLAFRGKKAELLLEFKFSHFRRPFRSQEVQTEVYALLAEKMGFDCEELCFGIVRLQPEELIGVWGSFPKEELLRLLNAKGTLDDIHYGCEGWRRRLLAGQLRPIHSPLRITALNWTAFLYRYDRPRAVADVAWALRYWRGQREPLPERRLWRKCFACPYNAAGLCEFALSPPDPQFTVIRSPDGSVVVRRQREEVRPVR